MAFRKGRNEDFGGAPMTPAPSTDLSAFIDQGSEFEGKLTFRDTVRIDGHFRGEISSENTLIVGESGEVEATVRSRNVSVAGAVVGDIYASHQLVLHKSARVQGDIEAGSISIEEGAVVNGRLSMSESSAQALSSLPSSSSTRPQNDVPKPEVPKPADPEEA